MVKEKMNENMEKYQRKGNNRWRNFCINITKNLKNINIPKPITQNWCYGC